MSTATVEPRQEVVPERLHRLGLDIYHEMTRLGFLTEADRVVLLDGLLVKKITKHPPHATVTRAAFSALGAVLPAGWIVHKEDPISLPGGPRGDSEPEPDLAVVRGDLRTYATRHPGPGDIALIVEIADSSLAEDRKALARYAWANIPSVWIVDLTSRSVEVYSDPSGPGEAPGYSSREVRGTGTSLEFDLDGHRCGPIPVERLLG